MFYIDLIYCTVHFTAPYFILDQSSILTQEFEVLTTPLDVCMIREGLASFLVAQVIDKKGEFHHPAS
jgi:hypothetical protein